MSNDIFKNSRPADPEAPMTFVIRYDKSNPNWHQVPEYNYVFVSAQIAYIKDLLRSQSFMVVNDVFDIMGVEFTREGMVHGWMTDDTIDFGVDFLEDGTVTIAFQAANIYEKMDGK